MTDAEKIARITKAINAMTDSYIDEGNAVLAEKSNKMLDVDDDTLVQLYDLMEKWQRRRDKEDL
jgi:hypothetical protein